MILPWAMVGSYDMARRERVRTSRRWETQRDTIANQFYVHTFCIEHTQRFEGRCKDSFQ